MSFGINSCTVLVELVSKLVGRSPLTIWPWLRYCVLPSHFIKFVLSNVLTVQLEYFTNSLEHFLLVLYIPNLHPDTTQNGEYSLISYTANGVSDVCEHHVISCDLFHL